ncbi:MAG: hypothetical protein ACRC1K_16235 [Planctomycetia bacterium]
MEAEAFDRSLGAFVHRRPFRSFTVELVSGARLQVDHLEALVLRSGVAVHFTADGPPTLFDNQSVSQLTGSLDAATPNG